jgi:hypothetical protein
MLIAGELYEISAINSATSITLGKNYLGSTQSGLSYEIVPTQSLVADLASDVTDLISDYATIANNAGAGKFNDGSETSPGITFNQDQDNGFYRSGSNTWVATVGGADTVEFNSTGVSLPDNKKINLGTSDDLQIYHDGSNSYIKDAGSGNLLILASDFRIRNAAGNEDMLQVNQDGDVRLSYDGATKLSTTSTGCDITGTLSADDLIVSNTSNNSIILDAPANRYNSIGFQTAGVDKWWMGRADSDQIAGDAFFIGTDEGNATDAGGLSAKLVLDNSGNLLAGTTSTSVTGGGHALVTGAVDYMLTGHAAGVTTGNYYHGFVYDGTTIGAIVQSGTTGVAYNTSSDYRLKEDVQPIENATDRLLQLNPCNFVWKADGSRVDGFLAHEAQEVVPEAVTGEKDAMRTEEYEAEPAVYEDVVVPAVEAAEAEYDDEGNIVVEAVEAQEERTESVLVSEAVMAEREVPDYQAIDQSKLVPLLVATIQELEARIKTLEDAQ